MPTVSVIVPVYNTATYLSRCIESLVNQAYSDIQIILIDDGSTDHSGAIADEWRTKDPRVEVYYQTNQGQSAARNVGLQHARGKYIAFVDADDYIDNDYLSTMLAEARRHAVDCVQTGYRRVQQNGETIKAYSPKHFYQYTSPCMRLYRREFIEQHYLRFPEGMIYEDVVFSIDLWLAHPTYTILPYNGYNYTLNTTSTTSCKRPRAEQELYRLLKQRWRATSSLIDKLLIAYTIIRLKIHFLKS
ncbi:MAG: glycosyltransferase family 2 protein [Paludibacteraceae bacterium]